MNEADRRRAIADLEREGLVVTEWRDDPNVVYEEHSHPHREVRIVLDGTMTISVGAEAHVLRSGDRLDLAPRQSHSAVVGPDGATYLAGTDR